MADQPPSDHLPPASPLSDLVPGVGFPPADCAAWRALVEKTVSGGVDKLLRRDADGLTVRPVYTAADAPAALAAATGLPGAAPFVRGATAARAGWDIRTPHAHPDPAATNAAILQDLDGGAQSIRLTLGGPDGRPGGLRVATLDILDRALADVRLDLAAVDLDAGTDGPAAAALLLALWRRRGIATPAPGSCLGLDPLGSLAGGGTLPAARAAAVADAAGLAAHVHASHPGVATVAVNGSAWYGAGATEAQDLACCVAAGTVYLRGLVAAGLPIDAACRQIAFTLDLGTDLFDAIAKLRAARRLWSRVCGASGAGPAGRAMRLGAGLSARVVSRCDPWVNMLRNTAACLAGAAGGADWILLPPHTAALADLPAAAGGGLPDDFARRIARNVQVILREESQLGRVTDPAGGSWFVESRTDDLARAAWTRFQDIERAGGLDAALDAGPDGGGSIADRVAAANAARGTAIARRSHPITGVSTFPNLAEPAVAVIPHPPETAIPEAATPGIAGLALPDEPQAAMAALVDRAAAAGSAAADLRAALRRRGGRPDRLARPLPRVRLAEPWERLRAASDRHLAATGARPAVYLAALGPAARHTPRLTFARNAFEAGGIAATTGPDPDLDTTDAVVAGFAASGATIAVLCGHDDDYAGRAATTARALKAAGCRRMWLAGRAPPAATTPNTAAANTADAWARAGIDGYIGIGVEILAVMQDAHHVLGLCADPGEAV